MAIVPITPINSTSMTAGLMQISQGAGAAMLGQSAAAQSSPVASFQEFFADAVKQTSRLDDQEEGAQRALLVGDTDNLHGVMIAMEKADMAFQLTMAVRNKVVEAYQEVMRMQI